MSNLQRASTRVSTGADAADGHDTPDAPAAFHVDGEPYLTASTAVELLTTDGVSPFGAYTRLRKATLAGHVRTAALGGRRKMYHHGDVHELADRLRTA